MKFIFCFILTLVLSLGTTQGLKAQPTPPDNKCDSLLFLNISLNTLGEDAALVCVLKNISTETLTDLEMKLEPEEMSGMVLSNDLVPHPDVWPGQTFSVFFPLENNLSELDATLNITGELISLPEANEFKCLMAYDKSFSNPTISVAENTLASWQLYPNPTKEAVYVLSDQEDLFFSLYDTTGRIYQVKGEFLGNQWKLDLTNFAEGIYFLAEQNSQSVQKIIIQ